MVFFVHVFLLYALNYFAKVGDIFANGSLICVNLSSFCEKEFCVPLSVYSLTPWHSHLRDFR